MGWSTRVRRAAEPRAKCLRHLHGPTPTGSRSHGAPRHPLGTPLLHLGQGVEPGSRVLLAELLDLEGVLLKNTLSSWLCTVECNDAGALSGQHSLGRLICQACREDEDLALLLHVLCFQTTTTNTCTTLWRHGAACSTRGH